MYRMILNETSYFGAGCRETIAVEAMRRGFKKAFFVTDKDLIRFKVADKIIEEPPPSATIKSAPDALKADTPFCTFAIVGFAFTSLKSS